MFIRGLDFGTGKIVWGLKFQNPKRAHMESET